MAEAYLGEIRIFAFNFAPIGWQQCNGQTLSISSYAALYALLGTTYGGNGTTTFQLPNLQSRVPVHQGAGQGLSTYVIGEENGTENVTLQVTNMPIHNHLVHSVSGATTGVSEATNAYPATDVPVGMTAKGQTVTTYSTAAPNNTMNANAIATAGGSVPHTNIQPVLCVNFCIAMTGIFPTRS